MLREDARQGRGAVIEQKEPSGCRSALRISLTGVRRTNFDKKKLGDIILPIKGQLLII